MNKRFAAFASLAGFALIPVPLAAIGSVIPMGAIWASSGLKYAIGFFILLAFVQLPGLIQDWTMLYSLGVVTYRVAWGPALSAISATLGMTTGMMTLFAGAKKVRGLVLARLSPSGHPK